MSVIARYRLGLEEKKRYTVKYANWMETDEDLVDAEVNITPVTVPPLPIATFVDTVNNQILLSVGDGVAAGVEDEVYEVKILALTTIQVKKDCIEFTIVGEC